MRPAASLGICLLLAINLLPVEPVRPLLADVKSESLIAPQICFSPSGTSSPLGAEDEERDPSQGLILLGHSHFGLDCFRPDPPAQQEIDPVVKDCGLPCFNEGIRRLEIFTSYDSYRGVSDGGWSNYGLMKGANFGTRLGTFSDLTGIGFQGGGSVGVFDWGGTDYRLTDQDEVTVEGFLTYGLFRRADEYSRWSGAVVNDWMLTNNYGVFAQNPTMMQWRAEVGYLLSPNNEIGIWGTWRGMSDSRDVQFFGRTTWRSVNQLNAFFHRKWGVGGPDTWIWAGIPEQDRLAPVGGSLGDYLAGAKFVDPLTDRLSLFALINYMHQSASPGPNASHDEAWNLTIGFTFYPGWNSRSATVAGQKWSPLLPVANNGYFLVDTDKWY